MPTTTFTYTVTTGTEVGDAFDRLYPGRPEGTTKEQWWKKQVIEFSKQSVRTFRELVKTEAGLAEAKAMPDVEIA